MTHSAPAPGLLATLLDLVWPRFCFACTVRLPARAGALGLCAPCCARLQPVDPGRSCRGCLRPLPPVARGRPICLSCQPAPSTDGVFALWHYRPPASELIRAFKFRGLDYLGAAFAAEAERSGLLARLAPVDLVVPMPLVWPRLLRRGFNQAERFARPVARRLAAPLQPLLRRRGLPGTQAGSGRRERLQRAPGSFAVVRPGRLRDRSVLLVDDVLTTGATARAAAEALRRAGAGAVTVLVAAWTPPEGPPEAGSERLDSPCTRT